MKFKLYDLLSHVIPGFLAYIAYLIYNGDKFDSDMAVPATVIAFVLGYLINTLSSWGEEIYYLSWKGKPSINLMQGKDIWKVRFYEFERANNYLKEDAASEDASAAELYSIALRKASTEVDSRVHDFSANYAFARALLTTFILLEFVFMTKYYDVWYYYPISFSLVFIVWLRAKQRAYYHSREVLNTYLKTKEAEIKTETNATT